MDKEELIRRVIETTPLVIKLRRKLWDVQLAFHKVGDHLGLGLLKLYQDYSSEGFNTELRKGSESKHAENISLFRDLMVDYIKKSCPAQPNSTLIHVEDIADTSWFEGKEGKVLEFRSFISCYPNTDCSPDVKVWFFMETASNTLAYDVRNSSERPAEQESLILPDVRFEIVECGFTKGKSMTDPMPFVRMVETDRPADFIMGQYSHYMEGKKPKPRNPNSLGGLI